MLFILAFTAVNGADITGFWQTIDDSDGPSKGKPKSITAVYERGGVFYGQIIALYNDKGEIRDSIYTQKEAALNMPGEVKPPYCGLVVIKDLTPKKDGKYGGGTITDPAKGKEYSVSAELKKDGSLDLRGSIKGMPFLGRTQTWRPLKPQDFPVGLVPPDIAAL